MNFLKSKSTKVFSHLMVWMVLFVLPYLLSSGHDQNFQKTIVYSSLPLCFYAILFYTNYFVLIPKFLFLNTKAVYFFSNALIIVVFIWLNSEIKELFFSTIIHPNKLEFHKPPQKIFIYLETIFFIVPVIFSLALKSSERWAKAEEERKEATNIKLQSELQHLKYQLQPHFFFNSLNNIYSLVDISPETAKQTIHSLGKLMRYLLYETNHERVSLKKEINFILNYIELMKLRLSPNTQVQYEFPDLETDLQIAPLLFISLIENAFKHGVSADKDTEIIFKMTVSQQSVRFYNENYNSPKADTDKSGSGIGLDNLEKRLELLYPGNYTFSRTVLQDKFQVQLDINL